MLPRKLSFPQLPPPPYPHKRSFQPTVEDIQALRLLQSAPHLPPQFPPNRPSRHAPPRAENPSPPLSRTPSPLLVLAPVVVVDDEAGERPARQSRPRLDPRNQLLLSEPQDLSGSASTSASASPSSPLSGSALLPTRSPRGMRPAHLQLPPHPPPPHPPPKPPTPPLSPHHADFDILPSEPFTLSPPTIQIPQQRSRFRSLAALRLSKATRQSQITEATARLAVEEKIRLTAEEDARRVAHKRELDEIARRTSAQELAKEYVQTVIETMLQGKLPPDDERASILSACAQACEKDDLDLSTVLQEISIVGYPPIYWAIVNRPVAAEGSGVAPDSLVLALLNACRPLSPATLAAIRVACMVSSDNVLLQRLFRSVPQLSPISTRDALLLGPANEEDRVDVEEKRNGTGSWVALIKIPRFRLRMRVCQTVSVEFIASGRIWVLAFSSVVETSREGRSESRWYLSLELGDHSPPTTVNANLVILGSSDATEAEPDDTRTIYFGHPMADLSPGRDKGIKIRLDDGPIGSHLLNESSVLVDSNKTLRARLTQTTVPASGTDASSAFSRDRDLITPSPEIAYSPVSMHPPRPPNPHPSWSPQSPPRNSQLPTGPPTTAPVSPSSPKRKKKKRNENYTSLRRGGR